MAVILPVLKYNAGRPHDHSRRGHRHHTVGSGVGDAQSGAGRNRCCCSVIYITTTHRDFRSSSPPTCRTRSCTSMVPTARMSR
ncbi:MAG: hypothetical protein MZV64_17090 [Ignavibacteriales bacterium]|nr:hypothetical protein [Ignavibacteriales bacterium]